MISHGKNIKIFSGNSHPALAMQIASALGLPLGKATISTFADGEISVSISESVRGSDVFLVQSTCGPVNNNLMELLIMIDSVQACIGRPYHRGHPVFRLRTPGPQEQGARPDLREARSEPHHRSRRRPRADHGPARSADPGLL